MNKTIAALTIAGMTALAAACSDGGGDDFQGTWKVADTGGQAFEIVLAADGKASANRSGEGMSGTWKKDGAAAVITWDTGWTTKIQKDGDKFTKVAYEKGGPTSEPKNTSPAEKVK
jgi:hypothetical protein